MMFDEDIFIISGVRRSRLRSVVITRVSEFTPMTRLRNFYGKFLRGNSKW